jgi:hypothetical protein
MKKGLCGVFVAVVIATRYRGERGLVVRTLQSECSPEFLLEFAQPFGSQAKISDGRVSSQREECSCVLANR